MPTITETELPIPGSLAGHTAGYSISKLRARFRNGTLDPAAIDVLDRVEPGWKETQQRGGYLRRTWRESFEATVAWRKANDERRPSRKSDSTDERRAAEWLKQQRAIKFQPVDRALALDEAIPGWREYLFSASDDYWFSRLNAVKSWIASSGERPRLKGGSKEESALASWVQTQRKTNLSAKRLIAMQQFYEEYRIPNRTQDNRATEVRLDEIAQWATLNGGRPSARSSDPVEASHANWIRNARVGTDRKRADEVAAAVAGWRFNSTARETKWDERLAELVRWINAHGSRPRQRADDDTERSLASWYLTQRTRKNLSIRRVSALRSHGLV